MRRILALVLCIVLFLIPVRAANAANRVHTTAEVKANGECHVTIEADIRLDDPARGLKFPLGKDIHSVTLNGTAAPLTQSGGITSVNLSQLDGKTGMYSCTISFVVNSVVAMDENDKQIVTVPLLYGFPYNVEEMSFSVTFPREFTTVPSFFSGYHGQDIERQMNATISGAVVYGSVAQVLKDIQQRDHQDMTRAVAPLKQAKDAVKVDTSDLDIDGVVAAIKAIIATKVKA